VTALGYPIFCHGAEGQILSALLAVFLTRAASPPRQIRLLQKRPIRVPSAVPHTAAARQPIGSRRPKLGRARIWPMALRVIEGLPTTTGVPLALLQPLGLRQVSRQRRASRFQLDFYLTAPATSRPLLPERPVLA